MTCQEFRRINATDASFRAATNAELSVCHRHYLNCRKCRRFIAKSKPDPGVQVPPLRDRVLEAVDRHIAIANDPECR